MAEVARGYGELLLLFVFTLLQIRVLEYAYEKIGINPRYIFSKAQRIKRISLNEEYLRQE
jgi:hypothetical protein